jgi:hypothetical protein
MGKCRHDRELLVTAGQSVKKTPGDRSLMRCRHIRPSQQASVRECWQGRRQRVFARPRPRTDRGASTRSGWRRAANSSTKDQEVHTTPQSEIYRNIFGHYFVALSRQVVSWKFDMPQIEFGTDLVTVHSTGSISRLPAVHRCAELFSADRFLRT